jgi:hypothetical protein
MFSVIMLATIAVAAFLVAWVANGLVGLLMGEKPRDTGSLWFNVFFRLFAVLELGFIGRILNYIGLDGLPRKIVLFVGMACVLLFLVKDCHPQRTEKIDSFPYHPVHSP